MANTGIAIATRLLITDERRGRTATESLLDGFSVGGVSYPALTATEYAWLTAADARARVEAHKGYVAGRYPGLIVDEAATNEAVVEDLGLCPLPEPEDPTDNVLSIVYSGNVESFEFYVQSSRAVTGGVTVVVRAIIYFMNGLESELGNYSFVIDSGATASITHVPMGTDAMGGEGFRLHISAIYKSSTATDATVYVPGADVVIS